MITDTAPFIELGWHTISLGGELKRLPNGKKTIPIFGKDWLDKAIQKMESKPSPLGGAITGKESGIIAIDCDNSLTFNMFKALDPDYAFHFISKGKKDKNDTPQHCGTIVYTYIDELSDSFKFTTDGLELDFLSTGRMTYLPTQANETKEPIKDLPALRPPPDTVISLIKSLQTAKENRAKVTPAPVSHHKFNLAPQVEMFVKTGNVSKALFKIITPHDFREGPAYQQHGYITPNDVEEGRGSEYLSKVSAILGADASVDVDLYCKAMRELNEQFDDPMMNSRLNRTIIEPMCEGNATGEDGNPIWQEDPDWQATVMTFLTRHSTVINVFYDYERRLYYVVDIAEERVQTFGQVQQVSHHLNAITFEHMKPIEVTANVPNVYNKNVQEKLSILQKLSIPIYYG